MSNYAIRAINNDVNSFITFCLISKFLDCILPYKMLIDELKWASGITLQNIAKFPFILKLNYDDGFEIST